MGERKEGRKTENIVYKDVLLILENVIFFVLFMNEIITPYSYLSPMQVVRSDYVHWRLCAE